MVSVKDKCSFLPDGSGVESRKEKSRHVQEILWN